MVLSNHITPGMTISINNKLFRVESSVKVTVPKGAPFIKAKLRDLTTQEIIEKSFKLNQQLQEVALVERAIEFLYLEGKDYLFLDINSLEQVLVPSLVVGRCVNYLKEGVIVQASFYGNAIFTIELPQFLELMVLKTEESHAKIEMNGGTKVAILETGAKIEVPPFIEVGDIIKVDTREDAYVQRV